MAWNLADAFEAARWFRIWRLVTGRSEPVLMGVGPDGAALPQAAATGAPTTAILKANGPCLQDVKYLPPLPVTIVSYHGQRQATLTCVSSTRFLIINLIGLPRGGHNLAHS